MNEIGYLNSHRLKYRLNVISNHMNISIYNYLTVLIAGMLQDNRWYNHDRYKNINSY